MVKRMLIDASHAEETRVVVANGTRLEEFDFETSTKKQLKGNFYLAKVMRVEPSLQAAFVEYGGNRHGFLPFGEIHPDYYQIPVADREALFAEQQAAVDESADEGDEEAESADSMAASGSRGDTISENDTPEDSEADGAGEVEEASASDEDQEKPEEQESDDVEIAADSTDGDATVEQEAASEEESDAAEEDTVSEEEVAAAAEDSGDEEIAPNENRVAKANESVETLGGDEIDDEAQRRLHVSRSLLSRRYKIQEVIKKRQIMLIQVVKEERGNKGAALTTYLSLAGRYCVLMPNAVRGGGISRKIVNAEDRKRLKTITKELKVPARMAMIVRTAGLARTRAEIKRDFEYLLRQWEGIREATLESSAPVLINEEANLIRRSIRDLYSRDIDQILVEGDDGYRIAKDFMRTLIPSHGAKVQPYRDRIPLFARYQIESQLDAMYSAQVQLRSGGYLVINPTEALVSIDVNSGRATKQRTIEETALKTNQEAADEIARQLRLRDLAGLVVIDFIDMDENRNQRNIERRFKEAMRNDRARIQIGRISPFGLLELSRQRLRPSLLETATEVCTTCIGTGVVRATSSSAVHVLRAIEEEGLRERSAEIRVSVPGQIALYILNKKRQALSEIESLYGMTVDFTEDASLIPPMYTIETLSAREGGPSEAALEIARVEEATKAERETPAASDGEEQPRRRRRRRKPRGARSEESRDSNVADGEGSEAAETSKAGEAAETGEAASASGAPAAEEGEEGTRSKRRRRGRRGGRRRNSRNREASEENTAQTSETSEASEVVDGADPVEPSEAVASPESGNDSKTESAAQDMAEAEQKPKRRSRRSPRRKPKKEADAESTAAPGEDGGESNAPNESAPSSDSDTPSESEASSPAPAAPVAAQSAAEDAPASDAKASDTKSDEKPADGDGAPRRGGWWQRVLS
ncbi:MAG: Rne/Rng family ribonuclease [Rhodospirillaceae bacterium]|nr:Rne/Rng family ribonuclease [Rhodospirillaceae bacterium]